jgi:hypothetical protein
MKLCKHRHNLKQGLLEKSKLAQHAHEEGHKIGGMKLGFWKLQVTAGIGSTNNWYIWYI